MVINIIVKTTLGNMAKMAVDVAKYKGKSKEMFLAGEVPYWRKRQSGVPEARLTEVLADLWDKIYGEPPAPEPAPEASKPKKASKAAAETEESPAESE